MPDTLIVGTAVCTMAEDKRRGMPKEIRAKVHTLTDDDIRERLLAFEKQFGMTSDEFLRRYNSGELGDNPEFIDWSGLLYIAARVGVTVSTPA